MIAPIDQSHASSWIQRWFSQQITHWILKPLLYNRWCFRRWWGATADKTRPSYRVWECRPPDVTWCTMFPLSATLVDSGHIIFWPWPVSGNEVSAYLMCFHCVWLSQYLRLWSEFKTGASYIQKNSHSQEAYQSLPGVSSLYHRGFHHNWQSHCIRALWDLHINISIYTPKCGTCVRDPLLPLKYPQDCKVLNINLQ